MYYLATQEKTINLWHPGDHCSSSNLFYRV